MFSSEEEGWADAVVGGISTVTNLAIELPSTLLVLISTALLLVWDYTCQGAQQVSDALGKYYSDKFELKFPELSRAELGRLRAEPSLGISIFELKPS